MALWHKNWLTKAKLALIGLAQVLAVATVTPQAFADSNIQISNLEINDEGEQIEIEYCINTDAVVDAGIFLPQAAINSVRIATLADNEQQTTGCYSFFWDKKHDATSQLEPAGTEAAASDDYFFVIEAFNADNLADKAEEKGFISVNTERLQISDLDIENRTFDPYDDQQAKFKFTITRDALITLEITDEDGDEIETIVDERSFAKGEHTIRWDGRDKFGEIVDTDDYEFKLTAESGNQKDIERGEVRVKRGFRDNDDDGTIDPRIKRSYVTKDEFDPGQKEKVYIVYTLETDADVNVSIYDSEGEKVEELLDEEQGPGTYAVLWDGEEVIGEGRARYTYRITATNSAATDEEEGRILVDEDEVSNNKPNVYKDKVNPTPFNPNRETAEVTFRLDRSAEVTVEIKDGSKTIITLVDEADLNEGPNTFYWDGRDKYGEYVDDGIYEYEITAVNSKGRDKEEGLFSVEGASKARNPYDQCGGFQDIDELHPYCEAIEWAAGEGIFVGYNDGTFRPNQAITRVEALKVVIEALDIKTVGSKTGYLFPDTDRYAWYGKYIETGLSLGIVNGYPDGYFRPNNLVQRVEAMVMLLNGGEAKNGIIIPSNTYGQPYFDTPNSSSTNWYLSYVWFARNYELTDNNYYFYPAANMTRGEMADTLYRYHTAGLDR